VQLIAWKDSSPNDILCVEWDVKPYTHSLMFQGFSPNLNWLLTLPRYLTCFWRLISPCTTVRVVLWTGYKTVPLRWF